MPRYRVRCGVEVAAIGDVWAAFSPASGETQLLNDEAAAILEVLDESPRTPQEVAEAMAKDSGLPTSTVDQLLRGSISRLVAAGLIEECPPGRMASETVASMPE
jgi:PqqD family protein of HPr-rel-A system